jgi:hypothetical protein
MELKIDRRQSETALAVQRGVGRLMRSYGFAILPEFSLASGRRADIIAVGQDGLISIVEIKSSIEDFRVDLKWPEYQEYCDRFFFAIPQSLEPDFLPARAGLIVADNWGAEIVREPETILLHAARRKALTLAFARCASQRLHSLYDPDAI